MLQPVRADCLSRLPGIAHGFFGRAGGVSQGIYASLNTGLGSDDDAAAVRENRARIAQHLGAARVLSVYQVHGTTALLVTDAWPEGAERPKADAMVTAARGIGIGVQTADCAPALFADPEAGIIGAAHAGWRGALAGVLEATIIQMETLGARRERIRAAVGPCIGRAVYEVGDDFKSQFLQQDQGSSRFFSRPAGPRPHFDLAGYAADRLARAGLAEVGLHSPCTYAQEEEYFSYRRARAKNEADYGRQISAIVLT